MKREHGQWVNQFEGLEKLPKNMREILVAGSRVAAFSEGTPVFEPGQAADNLLLLLDGTVRVQQKSETGREVFLYRVHAGESCVLTTACMLAFENYAVDGVAEVAVRAVAIPRATFDDLVARSPEFRQFVFNAFARRITDLFILIDDIVFQRMDVRLAVRLLGSAKNDVVHMTHKMLGAELGTAREVVSRTLSEFRRRGWIEQRRGEIWLVGRPALERLARSAAEP